MYSGYETFVKEVAERWVESEDIEVTVYCHRGLFNDRPKQVKGVRLVYLPAIELKSLSQLSHSFLAFVHACFSRFDVILAVNPANGPFGFLTRLAGISTAINMDGLEWLRPKWKGLGSVYFKWAAKMATRSYDLIINDSKAMRQIYKEQFDTDSIVIAYGSKVRWSEQPELIEKWKLKKGEYYLIVGRMVPDNNALMIAKGFMASASTKKLVIVGDVPFEDEYARSLKNLSEKDHRLLFTGYVTDAVELAELYHNAYVYLHGHEFGGTNPTMLKAMGYGCSILALNTPFNQEMLQGGAFGAFFEKTEASVTAQIEVLDQDLVKVENMKSSAREGITEKYTWDYVSKSYAKALRRLVH